MWGDQGEWRLVLGGTGRMDTPRGNIATVLRRRERRTGRRAKMTESGGAVQGLQWEHWSASNPDPDFGSVEGHQQQFRDQQRRLRNLLDEYNTRGCGDGEGLPDGVWEWATRPAPQPKPRENPDSKRDIDWDRVYDVVKALGLSMLLVGVVLWAVLSPDPFGELVAAGIGEATAAEILMLLGLKTAGA